LEFTINGTITGNKNYARKKNEILTIVALVIVSKASAIFVQQPPSQKKEILLILLNLRIELNKGF